MRAELFVLAVLVGCGGDASPREPIEELIALIKADDPSGLASLCVPEVRDGDARRVCMARREDAQAWAQVRAWLGDARVVRVAEFHGDEVVVEVEMGPDRRVIPMTVVNHEGRWLIDRF